MNLKNGIPIASTCTMGFNGSGNTVKHYPTIYPHSLLVGRTGTGKSYAARNWIYNFLCCYPQTKLLILDFKGEFGFSCGARYFTSTDCLDGLKIFVREMITRQENPTLSKSPWLLYIDELAATVTFADKKYSDEFKRLLSTVYMLSRAQNMFTLSSLQRADASTWVSGARDNIGLVMLLGELSKEACGMFSIEKDMLSPCPYAGMGHVLINGAADSLIKIRVPVIKDMEKVEQRILQALN